MKVIVKNMNLILAAILINAIFSFQCIAGYDLSFDDPAFSNAIDTVSELFAQRLSERRMAHKRVKLFIKEGIHNNQEIKAKRREVRKEQKELDKKLKGIFEMAIIHLEYGIKDTALEYKTDEYFRRTMAYSALFFYFDRKMDPKKNHRLMVEKIFKNIGYLEYKTVFDHIEPQNRSLDQTPRVTGESIDSFNSFGEFLVDKLENIANFCPYQKNVVSYYRLVDQEIMDSLDKNNKLYNVLELYNVYAGRDLYKYDQRQKNSIMKMDSIKTLNLSIPRKK